MKEIIRSETKKKLSFKEYDPAEYIETKEDVIAFLEGVLEENDPEFLFKTIGYIARSKGMARVAKELNLNREGLYTSLSTQGNPSFITIVRVLDNLGFRLSIQLKKASRQQFVIPLRGGKSPHCLRIRLPGGGVQPFPFAPSKSGLQLDPDGSKIMPFRRE